MSTIATVVDASKVEISWDKGKYIIATIGILIVIYAIIYGFHMNTLNKTIQRANFLLRLFEE